MSKTTKDSSLAFCTTKQTPAIRFLASLSDGRIVIQDNWQGQRHAWERLAKWIEANPTISITGVRLQGPNGIEIKTPINQKGYFFGQKTGIVWGSGVGHTYFGIGYYDGRMVNISWHRQPKFDHSLSEERTAEKAGFFLIKNTQ